MKPELYLTDALGAAGKPMFRVHTAGSVGGTTGIVAAHLVETGRHQRVLAVALPEAVGGQRAVRARLGQGRVASAPAARSRRTCAATCTAPARPHDIGPMVAVKDRQNALKNPYAHLQARRTSRIEKVKASPMMWDPVRFLESCPSSDGACAVVFTDEAGGATPRRPAGRRRGSSASAVRSEPSQFPGRDPVRPQARGRLRRRRLRAGRHHQPARADRLRRALRAVQLVRADVARGPRHRRATARAGRWSSAGDTALDGVVPREHVGRRALVEPDRRVRACCASPRPRCRCGAWPASTRSTGPRSRSAQAYGASAQYFAMWVVASSLDPFSN